MAIKGDSDSHCDAWNYQKVPVLVCIGYHEDQTGISGFQLSHQMKWLLSEFTSFQWMYRDMKARRCERVRGRLSLTTRPQFTLLPPAVDGWDRLERSRPMTGYMEHRTCQLAITWKQVSCDTCKLHTQHECDSWGSSWLTNRIHVLKSGCSRQRYAGIYSSPIVFNISVSGQRWIWYIPGVFPCIWLHSHKAPMLTVPHPVLQ